MKALALGLMLVLMLPSVAESLGQALPEPETFCHPCKSEILTDIDEWTITAYCPCRKCCGEWAKNRPGGIVYGASGAELRRGFCASPLPFGTVVLIEGVGQYTVHDRTADWVAERYGGRIIDLYFLTHEEALQFGKRTAKVWLVESKGE